eukprot:655983-Pelagomonas_calceolata.AAC.2
MLVRRAVSPLHQKENPNGDLEGYWKHPPPSPGCEKYSRVTREKRPQSRRLTASLFINTHE